MLSFAGWPSGPVVTSNPALFAISGALVEMLRGSRARIEMSTLSAAANCAGSRYVKAGKAAGMLVSSNSGAITPTTV